MLTLTFGLLFAAPSAFANQQYTADEALALPAAIEAPAVAAEDVAAPSADSIQATQPVEQQPTETPAGATETTPGGSEAPDDTAESTPTTDAPSVTEPVQSGSVDQEAPADGNSAPVVAEPVEAVLAPIQPVVETQAEEKASNPLNLVLTQVLEENGVYQFITALQNSFALDISNGSTANGANVQMFANNGTLAQYFKATWLGDGWYTFTNLKSGLVLDVSNASSKNGTNVAQFESNGTSAQKWGLIQHDDGSYSLVPFCATNTRLDIAAASTAYGANVQIFEANETAAQRFFLRKDAWLTQAATLANPEPIKNGGTYTITTAQSDKLTVDISGASTLNGANAQLYEANNTAAQKYVAIYKGNGLYVFQNVASGKVLDVSAGSTDNGANIQQYQENGTKAQMWYLQKDAATGTYLICSANSGKVMDVSSAKFQNGTNIHQWEANDTAAQQFLIVATALVGNGTYVLQSAIHDSLVLDIAGGSKNNGGNVQIYSSNGTDAQKYAIEYLGDDLYRIKNVSSGKYLDVSGADKNNGANVQQYQWNGTDAQKWRISSVDGHYVISSALNGRVLDVAGGERGLGTNVQMFDSNGTVAQLFNLKAADWVYQFEKKLNGIDISHWQNGLNLAAVPADFVILKATQGTHYFDPSMTAWADQAVSMGKLFGLYHFADASDGADPVAEANYFVDHVAPYVGKAVLILDWEADVVSHGVGYAKTWLDTVYKRTGVKPLIYMSNSVVNKYDWSSVANAGYGLWNAAYYYGYDPIYGYLPDAPMKGGAGAWGWVTLYQYTSSGHLSGYGSELDLDVFYGTAADWNQLASRV